MNYGARHEFLRELHKLLKPASYLEIGVQTGRSLALAQPPTCAIGVDPTPMVSVPISVRYRIATMTSDEFFAESGAPGERLAPIDLAFIDGMHLSEYALRDFMNVERHSRPDGMTVAVFDDVLPYSADIAGRVPLPGDWTGDVWRVNEVLATYRPDLTRVLVDVDPTGVLVVFGLSPAHIGVLDGWYSQIEHTLTTEDPPVPQRFLDRSTARQPADALAALADEISYHIGG